MARPEPPRTHAVPDSHELEQNPDYRLRIEVPNEKTATDARRLIRYSTGSPNPHPQIDIVVVKPE